MSELTDFLKEANKEGSILDKPLIEQKDTSEEEENIIGN